MDIIKLTQDKLDTNDLVESVSSPKCGAVSLFIGTTRDNFEDKEVIRLEYEAYEQMAIAKIKKICNTLREKWKLENIGVLHRLGLVPVKEASIIVAISSEHRKESLEAVHYAIDAIKAVVPIWKKEVYAEDNPAQESSPVNSTSSINATTTTTTAAAWKGNQECFWNPNQSKPNNGMNTA